MKISFVVPVYNEEDELNEFYKSLMPTIVGLNTEYEIIFVDDGSTDKTPEILKDISSSNSVKVITLSRNFGQQASLMCGFKHATGDCVIELDVKLDLPFNMIPKMIAKWKQGAEVVPTQNKLKGNAFTRFFKRIYLKFLHSVTNAPRITSSPSGSFFSNTGATKLTI